MWLKYINGDNVAGSKKGDIYYWIKKNKEINLIKQNIFINKLKTEICLQGY